MNYISQLKRDEGFSSTPYRCTAGKLTIGHGFNLDSGCSRELADAILRHQVDVILERLDHHLPWLRCQVEPRQAVVINMAFQMGVTGLLRFKKTLEHFRVGEYEQAANEMLDSKWAKKDTPARAKRLAQQMRTGLFV